MHAFTRSKQYTMRNCSQRTPLPFSFLRSCLLLVLCCASLFDAHSASPIAGNHSAGDKPASTASGSEASASEKEAALQELKDAKAALEAEAPPSPLTIEARQTIPKLEQAVLNNDKAVISSVSILNREGAQVVDLGTNSAGKKDIAVVTDKGDKVEGSLDRKAGNAVQRSTDRLCDGSSSCRSDAPAVLTAKATVNKDSKQDLVVKGTTILLAASMASNGGKITTTQDSEEKAAASKDNRFQSASKSLSSASSGGGGGLTASEQDKFVGTFVDHSKSTLGLNDNLLDGLTNVPVFRAAPPSIRQSVQSNLRSIVKMDANQSSPMSYVDPLVNLVSTPGFQSFGDRTLGSKKMNELNFSVAAAKLGKENSLGRAAFAGLAKGLESLTGVVLPFAWGNDPDAGSWTSVGAKGAAKAKFAALFGADTMANGAGEIIPEGETADLIERARNLSANLFNRPAASLSAAEAEMLRGRQDLEALIRSLKNLKSLDLLSLLQNPPPIERKVMAGLSSDKILEELVKMANKPIPEYKDNSRVSASLLKEKAELEQLRAFNIALLHKLRAQTEPVRRASMIEEVFANDKVRFLWRKYFEDGYRSLRRATAMLVVSVRSLGLQSSNPDPLGRLMNQAQSLQNKDLANREIARENRLLEEESANRASRPLPTLDEERW